MIYYIYSDFTFISNTYSTYISMNDEITGALIGFSGGIIGAVLGAYIGYKATLRSINSTKDVAISIEAKKNAVALYNEFLSPEMEVIREDASRLIAENNKSQSPKTYQEWHKTGSKESLVIVSSMVHFWEKTSSLTEQNFVDPELTKSLLKHYFEVHYVRWLGEFARYCCAEDHGNYQRWALSVIALAKKWEISAPEKK